MFVQLQSLFLLLVTIVSVLAKTTNTTSYISIRTKDDVDFRLSSSIDIINHATKEQPIVVFEFEKFKIIDAMTNKDNDISINDFQFLDQFFENHLTNVLDEVSGLERPSDDKVAFFKIKNIEQSGSNILYDFPVEDYGIVWFKFQKKDYDLVKLNDFIESASIFLEEYLNVNIDLLINTKDTTPLEKFDEISQFKQDNEEEYNQVESTKESKPTNDDNKDSDDDSLSSIWTEGLIMCLIVSFLLLGILIVAMSWIMSLEISYSALDKPVNPIKKTQ